MTSSGQSVNLCQGMPNTLRQKFKMKSYTYCERWFRERLLTNTTNQTLDSSVSSVMKHGMQATLKTWRLYYDLLEMVNPLNTFYLWLSSPELTPNQLRRLS